MTCFVTNFLNISLVLNTFLSHWQIFTLPVIGEINMNRKMLVTLPLTLLFATHAWAESSDEDVSTIFKNYMEIQQSQFFEQGWLPTYLPKSAVNIVALHNTKSKVVTATFNYDSGDTVSINENCSVVSENENSTLYSCENLENDISFELNKDGHGTYARKPLIEG